jgi:hypothetical protein
MPIINLNLIQGKPYHFLEICILAKIYDYLIIIHPKILLDLFLCIFIAIFYMTMLQKVIFVSHPH